MKLLDKDKLKDNIEKIAKYDLDNNNVFGSSYFVYQNGSVVFKKHFGFSDFEKSKKVNDGTIYRLASMTKPITAVAAMILVDRNLISLDEPVSKYVPEFENIHIITPDGRDLGKPKSCVTILNCLTHTSGFGSEKPVKMSDAEKETIQGSISYFIKAGLDFEPSSKQFYSAYGAFDVMAAIIEKVTKQDFAEFLKNEIFIPCDMPNTTFSPSEEQWERFITMHNKVDGKNDIGLTYEKCVFEWFPCGHKNAGAGLASTLDDYSKFAKMLLCGGKINDKQIISKQSLEKISTPYVSKDLMPGSENWGLGVRVITDDEYKHLPVGSFGWSGAFGSHFWVDPENDICAVFMKNSRFDGGAANCSARRFEDAVFDALI